MSGTELAAYVTALALVLTLIASRMDARRPPAGSERALWEFLTAGGHRDEVHGWKVDPRLARDMVRDCGPRYRKWLRRLRAPQLDDAGQRALSDLRDYMEPRFR